MSSSWAIRSCASSIIFTACSRPLCIRIPGLSFVSHTMRLVVGSAAIVPCVQGSRETQQPKFNGRDKTDDRGGGRDGSPALHVRRGANRCGLPAAARACAGRLDPSSLPGAKLRQDPRTQVTIAGVEPRSRRRPAYAPNSTGAAIRRFIDTQRRVRTGVIALFVALAIGGSAELWHRAITAGTGRVSAPVTRPSFDETTVVHVEPSASIRRRAHLAGRHGPGSSSQDQPASQPGPKNASSNPQGSESSASGSTPTATPPPSPKPPPSPAPIPAPASPPAPTPAPAPSAPTVPPSPAAPVVPPSSGGDGPMTSPRTPEVVPPLQDPAPGSGGKSDGGDAGGSTPGTGGGGDGQGGPGQGSGSSGQGGSGHGSGGDDQGRSGHVSDDDQGGSNHGSSGGGDRGGSGHGSGSSDRGGSGQNGCGHR